MVMSRANNKDLNTFNRVVGYITVHVHGHKNWIIQSSELRL